MPAISFKVFKDKILSGEKRQTIRPGQRIKKGDLLKLWWKQRSPKREKLGETVCTEVFDIQFNFHEPNGNMSFICDLNGIPYSLEQIDELAHRDGFDNRWKMVLWFTENLNRSKLSQLRDTSFQVIRWDKLEVKP